ncbi:hypothetical protein NEFER03_1276 [Nematocida sp. LUAm3]|nr:hypothetical protein NEFER03_1276 [Nematocida sp. LUAm3]KAI5174102.1 hypothetical protein NEFER02_0569 [Nematocida sp. LUAm2]KAI5177155.1 hypothetical protein NEFER01_0430 [Nematocida sp. LUAm1]
MKRISYSVLDRAAIESRIGETVILIGTVVMNEDTPYLKGKDSSVIKIVSSDSEDPYKLSEKEDEVIMCLCVVQRSQIQMLSWCGFSSKSPIDVSLYQKTFEEMQKYPEIFGAAEEN